MATIAYTNGVMKSGTTYQIVAHWYVVPGDEICCPDWVTVPGGGPLVVTEVVADGNDPTVEN
jgi:hypothetical protein